MAILKAAYPAYYAKISKEEAIVAVNLWADLFAALDNEIRFQSHKAYSG